MENKPTERRIRQISMRLPEIYIERAHFIMQELEIPSFAQLIKELINQMYFFLLSEKTEQDQDDDQEGSNDSTL